MPGIEQEVRTFSATTRGTWLSTASMCLMAATLVALFWFPVIRSFAYAQVNFDEGWNAYKQAMTVSRIPLYGAPPGQFIGGTGYPPFSFHFIGWLGRLGSFTLAGRLVSLISLIMTSVFVGLIVRCSGGTRRTALFALLLYAVGIAILAEDHVGMNDPQLLGECFSAIGLYLYLKHPRSNLLLCLSALAFCIAGFTKQTLITFPLAVALDLLLKSRKAFVIWAGALLSSAGSLLALTIFIDGRYFFVHLLTPRAYLYEVGWRHILTYVSTFQAFLVLGTAWLICTLPSRILFASAFFLSHLLAFLLAGGDGVDPNIFFNAFMMTVIVCGIALADITSPFARLRPAMPNSGVAAALIMALSMTVLINVPGHLVRDFREIQALRSRENEFRSTVQFVKGRSGPALCESMLLCYEAGKALEYEPFFVRDQLKLDPVHDYKFIQLLRTQHFQTVQINMSEDGKSTDDEEPFTRNFIRELSQYYVVAMQTPHSVVCGAPSCPRMEILIPKGDLQVSASR